MASSYNQKTVTRLRDDNWPLAETVEWYNHATGRRHDLFGLFDVLAISPGHNTWAFQVTSRSNMAARRRKLSEHTDTLRALKQAGWVMVLHGWDQPDGPRTKWRLKAEVIEP